MARGGQANAYSALTWGRGVYCSCLFFFFFQAEDGIRDVAVTGVQTCALPILDLSQAGLDFAGSQAPGGQRDHQVIHPGERSEERRVGKECRSRWSPYH